MMMPSCVAEPDESRGGICCGRTYGGHQSRRARGVGGRARGRGHPRRLVGRRWGPAVDATPPFEMDNRSKRSIVLDLTIDDGRAIALELISGADVFVTNVRPAALRRLGLDFESIGPGNPRLG